VRLQFRARATSAITAEVPLAPALCAVAALRDTRSPVTPLANSSRRRAPRAAAVIVPFLAEGRSNVG
jgi:hypothetical protein